jgi:ABC-type polysaccharide/polyol phosphate export permease
VRKVRFPREIIPAAAVSVQWVIFAVLIVIVTPVTLAVRGSLGPEIVLLPVLLVALGIFALGLGLAVAILHAYFRDVAPILSAVLLPWFFVTPIFFRPTDFPGLDARPWLGDLLRWANPISPFIEGVRDVVYDGRWPSPAVLAYIAVACALAVVAGQLLFRRMEAELAVVL